MTALQKTMVTATIAVLAGAGIYETRQAFRLRDEVQILQEKQASSAGQIQQLRREKEESANRLSALADEIESVKGNPAELLRLRGEVAMLRQQSTLNQAKSPAQAVAKAMSDSSTLELARIQMQQALKNQYAPLIHQQNISPETADALFNLIIDHELKKKVMAAQLVSGDLVVETALQDRDKARAELNQQIAALLGDSGFAQFEQFNRNTAASEALNRLNQQLGDLALNEEQSRKIQELLASNSKPEIIVDSIDLFRSKESLDALFQTLVDRGHRDLEEAASFLTPEQLVATSTIQSNLLSSLRTQFTLGQQVIQKVAK